jgi:agmatinase
VGVPYDYACGSRPGARWGPQAIRQSSLYFDHFLIPESDQTFIDISTGKEFYLKGDIQVVDLGDVDLFPMDVERTMETISGFIQQVVDKGAIPIVLGGDHFITYPTFCGYSKGISITQGLRRENIGYIHVDSHLDMYDEHPSWGKLYHSSTVRRIAESGLLDPSNMILIGVHGLVEKEIYEFLRKKRMKIITLDELSGKGFGPAVKRAMEELALTVESFYLSVDIDVVNAAFAPGTGGVSLKGFNPDQLLEVMAVLQSYPIGALDVVEVAPNYDPSERTQRLAAEVIFQFIVSKWGDHDASA